MSKMSSLISGLEFLAQTPAPAAPQGPAAWMQFLPMVLLFAAMYFLMIAPQRKKQKEADELQKSLSAGDEVITIGGAHGVVTSVQGTTVMLRMAEGKIEFDRSAVARKLPKEVEAIVESKK